MNFTVMNGNITSRWSLSARYFRSMSDEVSGDISACPAGTGNPPSRAANATSAAISPPAESPASTIRSGANPCASAKR